MRKFRKIHKINISRGVAHDPKSIREGVYYLRVLKGCVLTENQVKAARIALTRQIRKHEGRVESLLHVFYPKTAKPIGVRMGSGKGEPEMNVMYLKRNSLLFRIILKKNDLFLKKIIFRSSYKLPVRCEVLGFPVRS